MHSVVLNAIHAVFSHTSASLISMIAVVSLQPAFNVDVSPWCVHQPLASKCVCETQQSWRTFVDEPYSIYRKRRDTNTQSLSFTCTKHNHFLIKPARTQNLARLSVFWQICANLAPAGNAVPVWPRLMSQQLQRLFQRWQCCKMRKRKRHGQLS